MQERCKTWCWESVESRISDGLQQSSFCAYIVKDREKHTGNGCYDKDLLEEKSVRVSVRVLDMCSGWGISGQVLSAQCYASSKFKARSWLEWGGRNGVVQ